MSTWNKDCCLWREKQSSQAQTLVLLTLLNVTSSVIQTHINNTQTNIHIFPQRCICSFKLQWSPSHHVWALMTPFRWARLSTWLSKACNLLNPQWHHSHFWPAGGTSSQNRETSSRGCLQKQPIESKMLMNIHSAFLYFSYTEYLMHTNDTVNSWI